MRTGTIGYMLTPERERMLGDIAERLKIDLEDHGAVHRVIDFALQAVTTRLVEGTALEEYGKRNFFDQHDYPFPPRIKRIKEGE